MLSLAAGAEKRASPSQPEAFYIPPTTAARKRPAAINLKKILKTSLLSFAVSIISDRGASGDNSFSQDMSCRLPQFSDFFWRES